MPIVNYKQVGEVLGLRWPFEEHDVQSELRYMAEIKSRAVKPEKTDKEILADIKTYNEKRIK